MPETDERHVRWCRDLPVMLTAHPRRELLRTGAMRADEVCETGRAVRAQHHPELECPKWPAELKSNIVIVEAFAGGRLQILWHQRKSPTQRIRIADPEG